MEGYVDDMLVKSMAFKQHILYLKEVFVVLSQYHMKLNPSKCVFAIKRWKFLGFLVSSKKIEPNPKKKSSHTRHDALTKCEVSTKPYREIDSS